MNRVATIVVAIVFVCAGVSSGAGGGSSWPLADRLAWQIALDAAGFSPGIIDGKTGRKTETATREYQRANGLSATGILDNPTAAALGWDPRTAQTTYTVQPGDLNEIGGPLPKDWNAKARLTRLAYPSLEELVAEKFHCSRALLAELNPGKSMAALKGGDVVNVPAVRPQATSPGVARIEVDLVNKMIRAWSADGRMAGLFHCSVAKDKANLPSGRTSVVVISDNPTYAFDPAKWPEVKNVHQKLLIPPGPRNPVGLCWIGLGLSGYGIHGTPNPEMIGKTGSHGCIRMANWDAVRLSKMVRVGTPVTFTNSSAAAAPALASATRR